MPETTISLLSESIFRNIKVVDSDLKAKNLVGPTFLDIDSDGEHVENLRAELVDLLSDPLATLRHWYVVYIPPSSETNNCTNGWVPKATEPACKPFLVYG